MSGCLEVLLLKTVSSVRDTRARRDRISVPRTPLQSLDQQHRSLVIEVMSKTL